MVRSANLSAVLRMLHTHRALSRAELAKLTGLNKVTVSSLATQLMEAGLVHEVGAKAVPIGRPGTLLELNPNAASAIGVEIGSDFLAVQLTDFRCTQVWQERIDVAGDTALSVLLEQAIELIGLARKRSPAEVLGVCVGLPGLVDAEGGELVYSSQLQTAHAPIAEWLAARVDLPMQVDNEANLSAFGEVYTGAVEEVADLLYLSVGVGIHGGLMFDGWMARGHLGFTGSVGHMLIEPDGELCRCGAHGCWDTRASQLALFQRVHANGRSGSPLSRLNSYQLTVDRVVDAAAAGDAVALEALRQTGRWLGFGVASLVNTLNPAEIVIGGSLSPAAEYLLPEVHAALDRNSLVWAAGPGRIQVASHGRDACVVGGAATVLSQVTADPLPLVTSRGAL